MQRKRIGRLCTPHGPQAPERLAAGSEQTFTRGLAIFTPVFMAATVRFPPQSRFFVLFIMKIAVTRTRRILSFNQQDPLHRHPDQVGAPQRGAAYRSSETRTSLWSRFSEWVYAARQPQDMTLEWTCCGTPMLEAGEAYLGRVDSFELAISACAHCGMLWLGFRSVATTVTRSEPLSHADAEAFLAAPQESNDAR